MSSVIAVTVADVIKLHSYSNIVVAKCFGDHVDLHDSGFTSSHNGDHAIACRTEGNTRR